MISDTTTKELLDEVIRRATVARTAAGSDPAAREFSIAITAAEDAQMRYTRGQAKVQGVFAPADLET